MAARTSAPDPTLRRRILLAAGAEFASTGFAAARLGPIAALANPTPSDLAESVSDLLLDGVRPHDRKSRHAAAGGER
ncbi:MAG: hypothetical protein LC732_11555 [Acidobacteria bacterium]|nr:hypothetical protein [Acidobacteriota bacterium]